MKLTDEQWSKIKEVLPERKKPWLKSKRWIVERTNLDTKFPSAGCPLRTFG